MLPRGRRPAFALHYSGELVRAALGFAPLAGYGDQAADPEA